MEQLIFVFGAKTHTVCIDRCSFTNAQYAIALREVTGEVRVTNSTFKSITKSTIDNKTLPFGGRLYSENNRGDGIGINNNCPDDCCEADIQTIV